MLRTSRIWPTLPLRSRNGLLLVPSVAGALLALLPVLYLGFRAGEQGLGQVIDEVTRPQTARMLGRSAALTCGVTVLSTIVGLFCAFLVGATDLRFKRFWEVVLAVPLAIPTYVVAYTWIGTFRDPPPFLGSLGVLVGSCYPYVYMTVLAALKRLDPSLSDVGRSLGCNRRTVILRVIFPLTRPSTVSGALLVALYVLSDFGAISLLRYETLTHGIYLSYVGSFDRTPAAVLSVLLVCLTTILIVLEVRSRGAAATMITTAKGAPRATQLFPLGKAQRAAQAILALIVAVALGIPFRALVQWTLDAQSIGLRSIAQPFWSTILAAGLGSLACVLLAIPIATLSVRHPSRLSGMLEGSTYLGHSLPGLVIALSMVFIGVRFLTPIYQRLPLLTLAYVVLFLPVAIAAIRSSIVQAPPALEEVGRSLGLSPAAALRRITLPIAIPGIVSGFVLVTLAGVKELPATLLLRPTGFDTLATRIWTDTTVADFSAAAPSALALVALGGLSVAALHRTTQKPKPR